MLIFNQIIFSFPFYAMRIPNGDKIPSAKINAFGHGDGCNREFDEDCEAMRWDFLDAGKKWTEDLCNKDSDGDGQSNGLELGDPNCIWKVGDYPEYDVFISNPSDSEDMTIRVMPENSPLPSPPSPNLPLPSPSSPSPPPSPSPPSPTLPLPSPLSPPSPNLPLPSPSSPTPPPSPNLPLPSPSSPSPPSPNLPLPSPSSPSPRRQVKVCDVSVIGCGLAGATAGASAHSHANNVTICVVCPSIYSSTTALSGQGWLFLPKYDENSYPDIEKELQKYASIIDIEFNSKNTIQFMKDVINVDKWIKNISSIFLEPVTSHERGFVDPNPSLCSHVQKCCDDETNTRFTKYYGDMTCDAAKIWYQESNCCDSKNKSQTLLPKEYWPSYLHAKGLFDGSVQWFSSQSKTNLFQYEVVQEFLEKLTFVQGLVESIKKEESLWVLDVSSGITIQSPILIFANGGYGKQMNYEELKFFSINSTDYVHADNTRILKTLGEQLQWLWEPYNAWYLEFVDKQPKWFLWEDRATVLYNNTLVYNEAKSYDYRGRMRQKQNIPIADYLYDSYNNNYNLSDLEKHAIQRNFPKKECESRSERIWRNFLCVAYPQFFIPCVDQEQCETRIIDKSIRKYIYQGMIDTISGPQTNLQQQVLSDSSVFIAGNAGSCKMSSFYIAPGSTLGCALVSGYIAGKNAVMERQKNLS